MVVLPRRQTDRSLFPCSRAQRRSGVLRQHPGGHGRPAHGCLLRCQRHARAAEAAAGAHPSRGAGALLRLLDLGCDSGRDGDLLAQLVGEIRDLAVTTPRTSTQGRGNAPAGGRCPSGANGTAPAGPPSLLRSKPTGRPFVPPPGEPPRSPRISSGALGDPAGLPRDTFEKAPAVDSQLRQGGHPSSSPHLAFPPAQKRNRQQHGDQQVGQHGQFQTRHAGAVAGGEQQRQSGVAH